MQGYYRHTKIIATIGPATESTEQIERLIVSGVDVFRLNMAHASVAWVTELIGRIRRVSGKVERHVGIMMDLKGPAIRTGILDEEMLLEPGHMFELYTHTPTPGMRGVDVDYPGLPDDVGVGATVLLDSGLLRLEVVEKDATHLHCRVLRGGKLGSQRPVNVPGVRVNVPALTHKDREDLVAGVAAGIDFVALSFARRGEDIAALRELLGGLGSAARIIAKIEDQTGLRNLESIVAVADAMMVARGDLSVEFEAHILPLVQARIVEVCMAHGKPVIIATQLLQSMITAPGPTRAEIADVSSAVGDMVDALMLSGETASGSYPLESVKVLKDIIESIEPAERKRLNDAMRLSEPKTKMLRSAAVLAQDLGQSGIVVFTRSGALPYTLAALRAQAVPVYAFTDVESVFRQLLLPWGIEPFLMEFSADPEVTIRNALAYLKRRGWCDVGGWLVVITNALAHDRIIDTIQVRQVD